MVYLGGTAIQDLRIRRKKLVEHLLLLQLIICDKFRLWFLLRIQRINMSNTNIY